MLDIIRKVTITNTEEDTIRVGDQISIRVGDQISIPIDGFGTFTATAEEVTKDTILFIFDDIVSKKPMNEKKTNAGGFKDSQLYMWLQDVLLPSFPDYLRERISELTIPTVGQVFGWNDLWCLEHFERDDYQQLQLMKDLKHRVVPFRECFYWYWLQDSVKGGSYSASFALVNSGGGAGCTDASHSGGVRPAFYLTKSKTDTKNKISYGNEKQDDVSLERLIEIKLSKKNEKIEKGAIEAKNIMDGYIRAGFTENQAFRLVRDLTITIHGGNKR